MTPDTVTAATLIISAVASATALIIRAYRRRNGSNGGNVKSQAGTQSTEFWILQQKEAVEEGMRNAVLPMLEQQTKALDAIRSGNQSIAITLEGIRAILEWQTTQFRGGRN